ncbi:hypothetical protein HDU98_002310, partial [Podochytrium sp. JEL0797]
MAVKIHAQNTPASMGCFSLPLETTLAPVLVSSSMVPSMCTSRCASVPDTTGYIAPVLVDKWQFACVCLAGSFADAGANKCNSACPG